MNTQSQPSQMKYIGRKNIFDKIMSKVDSQDTWNLIGIDGDGGIGKTRLLNEIQLRYTKLSPPNLSLLKIIDFDDASYHSLGNVEYALAQIIGASHFESYLQKIKDVRIMEKAGISVRELQNQQIEAKKRFIEDFNVYSASTRVVLSFDTVEKLEHMDIWEDLLSTFSQLKNVVFLIAGRHPDDLWKLINELFDENIEHIVLQPLSSQDSRLYLKTKQEQLNLSIDKDLEDGLLVLSAGHPILLDLAIEWLSQDLPKEWMIELATQRADTGILNQRRTDFEALLVQKITYIRENIDRLILLLSRVYPLSVGGIQELLRISETEAQKLYEQAKSIVFFKMLPDEKISLHDEMRRMVNDHVWNDVDPVHARRKHDSQLAATYLKKQLARVSNDLLGLDVEYSEKETLDYAEISKIGAYEREKRAFAVQYLTHLIFSNLEQGVTAFNNLYDAEVSRLARNSLMLTVEPYFNLLEEGQKADLVNRKIKLLNDQGKFDAALSYAETISGNIDQQFDMRLKIANAKLRMGDVTQAIDDLEYMMALAEKTETPENSTKDLYNMLGQAYRTKGKLSEASRFYGLALDMARKNPEKISKKQTAGILNNLGFVWSLEGRYRSAFTYCLEALKIREQVGKEFEVGMSWATLGGVHRNWRKYDDALKYYEKALHIFEPANNPLWLARIYSRRGEIYRLLGDYEQAERNLFASIEYGIPIEKPSAYHILGLIQWNRSADYEQALDYLRMSDELARASDDALTHINNLVAMAEINYERWLQERDPILLDSINSSHKELEQLLSGDYSFPTHLGRMKRVLGDIAFEQKNYALAKGIYQVAYHRLGQQSGGYGRRNFLDEIEALSEKLKTLAEIDTDIALQWCDDLREYWEDGSKKLLRRDELISLCDVSRIQIEMGSLF